MVSQLDVSRENTTDGLHSKQVPGVNRIFEEILLGRTQHLRDNSRRIRMRATGNDGMGDKYQTDWITTLWRIQKKRKNW